MKTVAQNLEIARAAAKTPDQKTLVEFWSRTFPEKKREKEMKRFRTLDGVDQFEAWLLASEYFPLNFGVCGDVGLPQKEGGKWMIPTFVGRLSDPAPPIYVDATSGVLTCLGHPTVSDPESYIQNPKPANKPPLRMPVSGTPAAGAPVAPPSGAAGR